MKKRFYLIGLVALSLSMLLAACGNDSNDESTNDNGSSGEKTSGGVELGQKDLTLPYVAWARETPVSYLLAAVLEDVGYNVDVIQCRCEASRSWTNVVKCG